MSKELWADLPPFETMQREAQRTGWLYKALLEIKEKVEATNPAEADKGGPGGAEGPSLAALGGRFGSEELEEIRRRFNFGDKIPKQSAASLEKHINEWGCLPDDETIASYGRKLIAGRWYDRMLLATCWQMLTTKADAMRYFLQRRNILIGNEKRQYRLRE